MNFSYWENKYWMGQCDYLIVGMGLTGLQSAINIKRMKSNASVIVVDRAAWSLGASTRNAGFACFANVSEIVDDLKHESAETVYALVANRYKGLQKLRSNFTDKHIGYEEKGSVEVFTKTNKDQLGLAIDSLLSINSILYSETGLENIFHYSSKSHLPNMLGGIHNAYEGQLNTGKLYQTIFDQAQSIGIRLLGGMELKSWNQGTVEFANGFEMKANKIVFCTNAFSNLLGIENVQPARGQVVVSQRFDALPCEGLHVYDQGYYYWRDIDNRILLGGARNHDVETEYSSNLELNETIIDELHRFLKEEIVGGEVAIDYKWSGIMGMGTGKEKSPIVREIDSNAIAAVRLGGMGVALSALIAEEVAELLQ